MVGTFAVYRRQPGMPPPRDHELMSRMAQIAGIAIERRGAEDALRNSEAKFRGLFESVMEGVYQTSRDGRILVANPAFVKLLGYGSAEELYQVPAGALYWYPERSRDLRAPRREPKANCATKSTCCAARTAPCWWWSITAAWCATSRAGSCGYEGTLTDITERKKAETAVFQAKERAQVTLQSIGDAVITTDSEGRIDYMNPVAESLTGWENREAQGQLIGEVLDRGRRGRRAKPAKAR